MRVRSILVGILLFMSGVASQAGADNLRSGSGVQLDALNDRVGLLIVDEKQVYTLGLQSGKAELLVESRRVWFAADRRSGTVLVATSANAGYDLTLYSLKGDKLVAGAKQFIPVFVSELQSAKSQHRPTFLLSGPVGFKGELKDKVVPCVNVFVFAEEWSPGTFATAPVPGMSDVTSFASEGAGFAGDEKDTFAYTAVIRPESAASVKALPNAANVTDQCAFMVVREGKPVYACRVRTPIQGRCLQFSDDGERLLGHLGLDTDRPADKEARCKVISLNTGGMANWSLGDADVVLAVDGSLQRAVVGDNVVKAGATAPAIQDGPMGPMMAGNLPPSEEIYEWQVQVRREGRPPVVIPQLTQKTYVNDAAGTYLDGNFWVTDGKQMFRIDANDHITVTPIVGVTPTSGPAAK